MGLKVHPGTSLRITYVHAFSCFCCCCANVLERNRYLLGLRQFGWWKKTHTHTHTHNLRDEAAAPQVPSSHSSDSFLQACEVKDAVFVLR